MHLDLDRGAVVAPDPQPGPSRIRDGAEAEIQADVRTLS